MRETATSIVMSPLFPSFDSGVRLYPGLNPHPSHLSILAGHNKFFSALLAGVQTGGTRCWYSCCWEASSIVIMAPRYSQGTGAVTSSILDSIATKQDQHLQSIQLNQTYCKTMASHLLRFINDLPSMAKDCMSKQEIDDFIKTQKETIRKLAVKNVHRQRQVTMFVQAVQQVRAQTAHVEDPEFDFQRAIDEAMANLEANAANSQLEVTQEKLYLDVMEKLGERQGPVDEEVAIVETGASQGVSFKCPITGQMMNDAVRNKVCGHSYSRVGILVHIRNSRRNCECPMPGCANKNVAQAQLEDDLDMQHAVRREIRRQGLVAEQQARQADNLVESDED